MLFKVTFKPPLRKEDGSGRRGEGEYDQSNQYIYIFFQTLSINEGALLKETASEASAYKSLRFLGRVTILQTSPFCISLLKKEKPAGSSERQLHFNRFFLKGNGYWCFEL